MIANRIGTVANMVADLSVSEVREERIPPELISVCHAVDKKV